MFLKSLFYGFSTSIINISKTIAICTAYKIPIGHGIRSAIWGGIFSILCQTPAIIITCSILSIMLIEGISEEYIGIYVFMSSVYTFILLYFNIYPYISLVTNSILDSNWICIVILTFFSQLDWVAELTCKSENFDYNIYKIVNKISCLYTQYDSINYYNLLIYFSLVPILLYLNNKNHSFPWYTIIIIIFSGIVYLFKYLNINLSWETVLKEGTNDYVVLPFKIMNLSFFDLKDKFLDIEFHSISFSIALMNLLDCYFTLKYIDRVHTRTKQKYKDFLAVNLVNFTSIITGITPTVFSTCLSIISLNNGLRDGLYALINGLFCLWYSLFFLKILIYTPKIVLDIVLITICIDISNFKGFYYKYKYDRKEFIVMIFTIIFTLIFKGVIPLILGMIVYLMINSRSLNLIKTEYKTINDKIELENILKNEIGVSNWEVKNQVIKLPIESIQNNKKFKRFKSYNEYNEMVNDFRYEEYNNKLWEIEELQKKFSKTFIIRIIGNLTYLNINNYLSGLEFFLNDDHIILISLRFVNYADHTSIELFNSFIKEKENNNKIKIIVIGSLNSKVNDSLGKYK